MKKKILSLVLCGVMFSSNVAFGRTLNSNVTENTVLSVEYDHNGIKNAAYEIDNVYDENGEEIEGYNYYQYVAMPKASYTQYRITPTGGKVTSNVWVSIPNSSGEFNYQVSANYDKSDHTDIKTTWFGQASANSGASFGIGFDSISFGSSTSTASTTLRYWQNTNGQRDASYASNGFVAGEWIWIAIENRAQVWGGDLGPKPTEVNARATINK